MTETYFEVETKCWKLLEIRLRGNAIDWCYKCVAMEAILIRIDLIQCFDD